MTEDEKKELAFELWRMDTAHGVEERAECAARCVERLAKALGVEPWSPLSKDDK